MRCGILEIVPIKMHMFHLALFYTLKSIEKVVLGLMLHGEFHKSMTGFVKTSCMVASIYATIISCGDDSNQSLEKFLANSKRT